MKIDLELVYQESFKLNLHDIDRVISFLQKQRKIAKAKGCISIAVDISEDEEMNVHGQYEMRLMVLGYKDVRDVREPGTQRLR